MGRSPACKPLYAIKRALNILLIHLLLGGSAVYGQEFSFEMYFEDALGNKDTLTFGYDINATDTIDISFGEVDISTQPWGNSFEVRLSNYNYDVGPYHTANYDFYSVKQIQYKDCGVSNNLISSIHFNKPNYPVTISWDSTLFYDPCRINSLVTGWGPGGWFDAVWGGDENVHLLRENDTVQVNEPYHHNVNLQGDTTDIFYITIANEYQVFVGIEEYYLQMDKELIKIVDLLGRESENLPNTPLLHIFSDGTTAKVFRVE